MEIIKHTEIVSVNLFDIRVSEDEIDVYEAALSYLLKTLPESQILELLGCTKDELEGMRDDLYNLLDTHTEIIIAFRPNRG